MFKLKSILAPSKRKIVYRSPVQHLDFKTIRQGAYIEAGGSTRLTSFSAP